MASPINAGFLRNFSPNFGAGQTLSVGVTSTAATAFANADLTNTEIMVFNGGTTVAYARWGVGAQTATANDVPLPPGSVQVFYKGPADNFAAISASGTNAVTLITGSGQ